MNGYFVHALLAEDRIRTLKCDCERSLPRIQREFGLEITLDEVFERVWAHRDSLELVERFNDAKLTVESLGRDLDLYRNNPGSVVETIGFSDRASSIAKSLSESYSRLLELKNELRIIGVNPENCSFPNTMYELYKSASMVGEQTEMEMEDK
ncbi:MAG: hypothetical protein WC796_03820 [Candidatus Pacearchaeota archaeon]|jgi:hypothetical protein